MNDHTETVPTVSQAAADQAVEQLRAEHTHKWRQDIYDLYLNCACKHWHHNGGRFPDKHAMARAHLEHLGDVIQRDGPALAVLIDRTLRLPTDLILPDNPRSTP